MWSPFGITETPKVPDDGDSPSSTVIDRPDGKEYMTVTRSGDRVQFLNFGKPGMTIQFDVSILDQLIPALIKIRDNK